jgi:hypothetical protein
MLKNSPGENLRDAMMSSRIKVLQESAYVIGSDRDEITFASGYFNLYVKNIDIKPNTKPGNESQLLNNTSVQIVGNDDIKSTMAYKRFVEIQKRLNNNNK